MPKIHTFRSSIDDELLDVLEHEMIAALDFPATEDGGDLLGTIDKV
jgi:hypothetical protein